MNGLVRQESFLMAGRSVPRGMFGLHACIVSSVLGVGCVPEAELSPSCEPATEGHEEVLYGFDTDEESFELPGSTDATDVSKSTSLDWVNEPGANGAPGALRLVVPFDSYDQYVAVQIDPKRTMDFSARVLRACIRIEGGFSPDSRAPGDAILYVKTGDPGYYWGQGFSTAILPSSFGKWLPIEFDLENPEPDQTVADYSPDQVRAIGMSIRTGSGDTGPAGIATELPGPTIAYVDQITVVSR